MRQKPIENENWQERKSVSYSPNFIINAGNLQMELNKTSAYDFYTIPDNIDVFEFEITLGKSFHIHNNQHVKITGGQKSSSSGSYGSYGY